MQFQKMEWTPEMDAVITALADGKTTIGEITVGIELATGRKVSKTSVRKRMLLLGSPMVSQGGKVEVTAEMRDFVAVKAAKGMTIEDIRTEFNKWFGLDWSPTRIYRVMLSANAERHQRVNKTQFYDDWSRLQQKMAPSGEICRKNWLWRWRRLDENRTAAGVVFYGSKVEIP